MSNGKVKKFKPVLIRFSLISILMLFPIFSGCVVGPNFTKPKAKLNDNWSQQEDARVQKQSTLTSQWWTTFNDPILNKLEEEAFAQNLTLRTAGLRIIEARAQLGIAIGQQYPQTQDAFGSITNQQISKNAPNSGPLDHFNWDYQVGFDAIWELDFWGKFRRGVEVDTANWAGSIADYDFALVSLTSEVARTYTLIRTSEEFIALANENIKVQQEGLQIAESRYRNGATTELDVMQAKTLLASTQASVPKLQISLKQAEDALSTLLGQPAGNIRAMIDGTQAIPVTPYTINVVDPTELLKRRPDIRSAELAAAAQCARIGIAKADFYPSISIFGTIGFETSSLGGVTSSNAHFHNFFDGGSAFFAYGPSFSWPIFNYGRIENNVRVQDARYEEAITNYQNTVLNAVQEVEDSLTGFLKSQEAAVYDQNSVDAAKRSVEISMTQYREGATDYERVLDSQRALLEQENSLAQTQSDIATNYIAVYKAFGGGWEMRQGRPVVPQSTVSEMRNRTNWGKVIGAPVPQNIPQHRPARDIPLLQPIDW